MDLSSNWGRTPPAALPPCSMVITEGGLLAAKITSVDEETFALVGYVASPEHSPRFLGRGWIRTLNMPYAEYAPLIAVRQPEALDPRLGKIARIASDTVVATMSAQDPALLAEHADALEKLATWCGIRRSKLGIYGSAMYKAAGDVRDLDIVVYGLNASRRVHARATGVIPPRDIDHPHHPHFQTPGGAITFDPRYLTGEHKITGALVAGDYTDEGPESINGLWVLDASEGIFFPARYTLNDDTVLLSYRAGHSGWLHIGDELLGPPLPVYRHGDIRYRMVLGCETLHPRRAQSDLAEEST